MNLRIAGLTKESIVDGPGIRYTIFTQGCPHKCVGCHNPQTHDFAGGYEVTLNELLADILNMHLIQGVTFSGGEPFVQAASCARLAQLIKQHRNLDVVTYTGYYFETLLARAQDNPAIAALLEATDILIDGPYEIKKHTVTLPFRGSTNQSMITVLHKTTSST